MPQIDTLIHNATIVTVDADFRILTQGAISIRDGKILQVWSPAEDDPLPEADERLDMGGMLVMPGLINAHTHLPMSLFRGLADDLALEEWLNGHIFPAEAQHINPDSVALGARLSIAEMLLSGTTCCCEGYFLADQVVEAITQAGLRAVVGQGVIDFPAPGVADPGENVAVARQFVRQWQGQDAKVQPAIFCHSPYTCSAKTLQAAKQAANELGVLFQIHVAETEFEAQQCHQHNGCSPVAYLNQLGLLDDKTLLVHAVWVDNGDIEIMADHGVGVAHCPESNMKLASGISPVPDMLCAGIAVGLGTDGSASNNDLDLWGEMDSAAKLHKVHRRDSTVMDAATVLRMATLDGARALGLDHAVGSLAPGKQADLIVINLAQPHLAPIYHPASHLVYAVRGADVSHVMIGGQWVVRNRSLLTLDLPPLLQEITQLGHTISGSSHV